MSRRVFAKITETGICNEKGRASYTIVWNGRFIADERAPLSSLFETVFCRVQDIIGWESSEDAEADVKKIEKLLDHIRKNIESSTNPTRT